MTKSRFDRDDITAGLRALIAQLQAAGVSATIRIVGGAAISLAYNADRGLTVDIDAEVIPRDVVIETAGQLADKLDWDKEWLNDAAHQFFPDGFGQRSAEWVPIYSGSGVDVYVASAETLLAMKLKAAQRRGAREVNDLRVLLTLTGLSTVEQAEELYSAFYPADAFTDKAVALIEAVLRSLPESHHAPEPPTLGD